MKRLFFLIPIIGLITFIIRGGRVSDFNNSATNILLLGMSNGFTIGFILIKIFF